jgi:hypothetical protein
MERQGSGFGGSVMPPIQYWFSGAGLAAFLALLATVSTLSYGWYRAAVTEMDWAKNRADTAEQGTKTGWVKSLLGKALTDGGRLLQELNNKEESHAETDAEAWDERTRDLIASAYGDGEATLFLDSSGYVFYSDGSPKSKIRNWIDGRMRRITALLPNTDSLNVRKEFDPQIFD